jgi:two-component system cell cycle response regulator
VRFCELVAESAANALERAYLLEDLRRANADLERMARTDGLTGLYNRVYFRQRLDEEVSRAVRYNQPLACMFVDADDFKTINDVHGHLAGDGVLRDIGERILRGTRRNDICARYGGEEFVILLPHTARDGAIRQASRLLSTVASGPFTALPEESRVTVSIGLAMFDPNNAAAGEALLSAADSALYKAKALGKNRLVIGDEEYGC